MTAAVGEGIYPNSGAIFQNPRYKEVRKEGRLKGKHWDFVNSDDLEAAYFKWVTAPESWGVRLFYLGTIFEKAGMYEEALRAYHALVVHFPKRSPGHIGRRRGIRGRRPSPRSVISCASIRN